MAAAGGGVLLGLLGGSPVPSPSSPAVAAASATGLAAPDSGTISGRGSTYSLKFSHCSPNGVALANPASTASAARMQIGMRISFGDSCGGWAASWPWSSWAP